MSAKSKLSLLSRIKDKPNKKDNDSALGTSISKGNRLNKYLKSKKKLANEEHTSILSSLSKGTGKSGAVKIKKRRISIVHKTSAKKKQPIVSSFGGDDTPHLKQYSTVNKPEIEGLPISQSKISSSFVMSLNSKNNQPDSETFPEDQHNNFDSRQNEMELTDKPLKSVFLFKNMKEMPINCSEKDSITYKIGKRFLNWLIG